METTFNPQEWPELLEGDPLADAVVADWFEASSEQKGLLLHGIKNGAISIPLAPKSYQALLEQTESDLRAAPSLVQAAQAYMFAGATWLSISTGPGALLHTYTDPQIVNTLVHTGRLSGDSAAKRLSETLLWLLQLFRADAWHIGGSGYVHTLQVRLIHAKVRAHLLRKNDANTNQHIPIDQRQLVRTWLDFSVVSTKALELLGISWTESEKANVAALWQLVGALLGIHPRVMSDLSLPGQAERWLQTFDQNRPSPDEHAKELTQAMLTALGKRMSDLLKLPENVSTSLMHCFARHIHGDDLAHSMGATDVSVASLVPVYIDANRYHMERIRRDLTYKQTWLNKISTQIDTYSEQMNGSVQYQKD